MCLACRGPVHYDLPLPHITLFFCAWLKRPLKILCGLHWSIVLSDCVRAEKIVKFLRFCVFLTLCHENIWAQKMITAQFSILFVSTLFADGDLNHWCRSREGWVRSPPHEFWQKYHSAPTPQYQSVTNFLLLLFYASLRHKIQMFSPLRRDILKNIKFASKPLEKSSNFSKTLQLHVVIKNV